MRTELHKILLNSNKGDLIDGLKEELKADEVKAIVLVVTDEEDEYIIHVRTVNVGQKYELYGILEAAKWAIQQDDVFEDEGENV